MRFKATAVGLGLLLAGLIGGQARAEEGGKDGKGKRGRDRGEWMEKAEERLGLSEEQRDKLKAHRKSHREKGKALREAVQKSFKALREELEKETLDKGKVRAAHKTLKEARGRLADHRLEGILEVRTILTAEQFKKLKEGRGKGREGWSRGRGRDGRGWRGRGGSEGRGRGPRGEGRRRGPPDMGPDGDDEGPRRGPPDMGPDGDEDRPRRRGGPDDDMGPERGDEGAEGERD